MNQTGNGTTNGTTNGATGKENRPQTSSASPNPLGESGWVKVILIPLLIALIGLCGSYGATVIGLIPDIWDHLSSPDAPSPTPTFPAMTAEPITVTPATSPPTSSGEDTTLQIVEFWLLETACHPGHSWSVELWVRPQGGDGSYSYYIDGVWYADSINEGKRIHLDQGSCLPIESTLMVHSAGEVRDREFSIPVPACCK